MKPAQVFRGDLEGDQNVSLVMYPDNKGTKVHRRERHIQVRFQAVFPELVRPGGKMKQ